MIKVLRDVKYFNFKYLVELGEKFEFRLCFLMYGEEVNRKISVLEIINDLGFSFSNVY